MNLEDILEARLAGEQPDVPEALDEDLRRALAAHEALQFALGETILLPASDAEDRSPPQLPADYKIVRELGRGGMGVVYLARQASLDRLVAVKVLRPGELAFGPMVRRFLEEARHLARLRHPNLVSVHEVGEASGEPYFSMDYIEGESLADLMKRERLSPSRTLAILKQAAEGVAHAHQAGVIHRDLKPANILIDAVGRAYVTDFGLARNLTDESDRTHSGAVIGTPQYMAPEQARGEARLVGETTDVHALGAILYEMLTGRPPYGSDNPMQILVRLVHEEPPPPRRIDQRISRDLETICLKALAKQPVARYATVRAILEDIHRYETGQPLMARRPGIGHHARRLVRRYGKIVAAAVVAATAVLALAPKLFDKSVDELVNWGEYEHGAGRHFQAAHIFHRAFQRATSSQRSDFQLLWRMERCVQELDDPRQAVNLALEAIEDVPDASFGKYDYLVAQALLTRLRSRYPDWTMRRRYKDGSEGPHLPKGARPLMQLLDKRLAIALQGHDTSPSERRLGEEIKALVTAALAGEQKPSPPTAEAAAQLDAAALLAGTPSELLLRADDDKLPFAIRLEAAFRAGAELENAGDMKAALAAYNKATLFKAVFPFYGLKVGNSDLTASGLSEQVRLCQLGRDASAARRRLSDDPDPFRPERFRPDQLRGGLHLRFQGIECVPQGSMCNIVIWLREDEGRPEVAYPNLPIPAGRVAPPSGQVHLVPGQIYVPAAAEEAWVGGADGHYRLGGGKTVSGETRFVEGLQLDLSALPQEVDIHGQTLDLPPIRMLVASDITLVAPAEGSSVDLLQETFRWTAVEGAVNYNVRFGYEFNTDAEFEAAPVGPPGTAAVTETSGRHGKQFLDKLISTRSTGISLLLLPREQISVLSEYLKHGRTALWSVEAYDANNQLIGKSYQIRRFLVARGLAEAE